ncbi:AlpA family phage regulatory protein [Bradyrhizobium diazoefficiens]|nr:AlpA family phage regulatory protein [Bradyrhizobium diazoefficiens]MBR0778730.1 AlpA family phage regulatory protein [Bradyrhizobium diazoefficiens]
MNKISEAEGVAPDKTGPRRMLNEQQVLDLIPISRATLYRMIKDKKFPGGTFISPHRRVWYEDEIIAWQEAVDGFNLRGKHRRQRKPG